MATKEKKEPCPKWMRHKWKNVGDVHFSDDESAATSITQKCVFCGKAREVQIPVLEETEED